MADGVDAAVQTMKTSGTDTPADCVLREPGLVKLLQRHDPVLAGRQFSDPSVPKVWADFPVICAGFWAHTPIVPPAALRRRDLCDASPAAL